MLTPAATIMLGELGTEDDLKTYRKDAFKLTVADDNLDDEFDARPSARHSGFSNLGFLLNGHCQAMRLGPYYTDQNPPDKWFCLDFANQVTCSSD